MRGNRPTSDFLFQKHWSRAYPFSGVSLGLVMWVFRGALMSTRIYRQQSTRILRNPHVDHVTGHGTAIRVGDAEHGTATLVHGSLHVWMRWTRLAEHKCFFFVANFHQLATTKKMGLSELYKGFLLEKKGSKSPYFEEKQVWHRQI
jgi:hypothetical protein